jgi:D-alanyl-D-alanine carboxypeptidase
MTCPASAYAAAAPSVQAEAAIVQAEDGSVLYAKNADSRRLIASTTKLMTALVCLENASMDDVFTAQERHCRAEGSSMYLKTGERYTVRELLLGLLLSSGNDAALALAEHTAGSEEAFVRLMNRKARDLGLRDTHFENPHGLDAKTHYSTARDLARLMFACMENEAFRSLTALRAAEVKGLTLLNHNKLLAGCPGCVGGKTGYTRAAGRCLVSCCERDGLRLVCVTLSDPDDWNDHQKLYDWAYGDFVLHDLSAELSFDVPVISGSRSSVRAVPAPGARVVLPRGRETPLSAELPRFVFAPVSAGENAGTITVNRVGNDAVKIPLVYTESAEAADPCIIFREGTAS